MTAHSRRRRVRVAKMQVGQGPRLESFCPLPHTSFTSTTKSVFSTALFAEFTPLEDMHSTKCSDTSEELYSAEIIYRTRKSMEAILKQQRRHQCNKSVGFVPNTMLNQQPTMGICHAIQIMRMRSYPPERIVVTSSRHQCSPTHLSNSDSWSSEDMFGSDCQEGW